MRVVDPRLEPALLLLVADREPVLEQQDAVLDQQPFEDRALVEEAAVLLGRAEAEHVLDAGAVVPAAVEQDELAARRQVLDVALEVPLLALAFGRTRQRDDAGDARVEVLGDALDRAALARGVPALEDHHDAASRRARPLLNLHELRLEPHQLLLIGGTRHPRRRVVPYGGLGLALAGTRHDRAPSSASCAIMGRFARTCVSV